jgi:lysophospholipase L1-like esterase
VAAHRALLTTARAWPVGLAIMAVIGALVACTSTAARTDPTSRAPTTRSAPAPPASAGVARPRVVFLGDSYTFGSGASSPAKRWSSVLAAAQGWTEINEGVGGTGYGTRRDRPPGAPYPERLAEVVAAHPDIVVVSGGINDLRSAAAAVARGVGQTYSMLRSLLPSVRLIALAPFSNDAPPAPALRTIAAEVHAAATAAGAEFVDPGYVLEGHAELVHQSGPHAGHPNDAGYARMAAAIGSALATQPNR